MNFDVSFSLELATWNPISVALIRFEHALASWNMRATICSPPAEEGQVGVVREQRVRPRMMMGDGVRMMG